MSFNALGDAIRRVVSFFNEEGYKYALVGGLAVSFRTIERTTKDVDIAVSVFEDQESESIVRSLQACGFEPVTLLENKRHCKISTVRLLSSLHEGIFVDLLFNTSGIEREVVSSSEAIEILEGLYVNIASTFALIAMKTLSSTHKQRRQDLIDLDNLIKDASSEELTQARILISLIESRGYNDGKDLQSHFNKLLIENDR